MELCIGIGFVILCFAILVFVIGFFGYIVHIEKNKELDIAPFQKQSSSNDMK